jgi:CRP-like cAMP-binding protein
MTHKLEKIPMFKNFPPDLLEKLSSYMEEKDFSAGDSIFYEGDEGDSMYFIESGNVEIRKKDKMLTVFAEGDIFGEMALYENARRSADAVAKTDCKTHFIRNEDFKKFISEHLEACSHFLFDSISEMSRRLRRTSEYLITVFETGKIVGGDFTLTDMAGMITKRLVEDIGEASNGMMLILNPFTETYDEACNTGVLFLDLEKAVNLIKGNEGKNIGMETETGYFMGVPITEAEKILGYIFLEKSNSLKPFTVEQEVIVSAVGNQVGLGIIKAYNKQEEEARQRLERHRMKGY